MLKQRLMTAAILIPLALGALFFLPALCFDVIVGVVALYAAWEWTNFLGVNMTSVRWLYLIIIACILFNLILMPMQFTYLILLIALGWWLIATGLVIVYPRGSQRWRDSPWLKGIMGVFVMVPCWLSLIFVREQQSGIYALLFLFLLIWGADSAAYFVGRWRGKHKLAPLVSPGKSLEGVAGAIIFAVILSVMLMEYRGISLSDGWALIALSMVVVLFSIVGDLFESMLKREMGVKDSGTLLPGHGGLLDRIDSLTAAAPMFVLGVLMLS